MTLDPPEVHGCRRLAGIIARRLAQVANVRREALRLLVAPATMIHWKSCGGCRSPMHQVKWWWARCGRLNHIDRLR